MKENYDLTIIMSNYNQEKYISQAIESVLSQVVSFKYKLIITDDCSCDDKSKDIIQDYANKYDNIETIFSTSNGGYLTNILRAKARTKTRYFCLLDADDYWTDVHFLQHAIDFLNTHEDFAIYEANVNVVSVDEHGNESFLRPFISRRCKAGTYSKEMFCNNKPVPITQTTGMIFRNNIFINGIPVIMKSAIGTRSERSFEGDTGRFIMHLKTGLAYYDSSIVGVYRVTPNGIWTRLSDSKKVLISARSYQDYYHFYKSNVDYFVSMAYRLLQRYFIEKQNEVACFNCHEQCFDEYERLMVEDIYRFCKKYKRKIIPDKKGIKYKLKQIIRILRSE